MYSKTLTAFGGIAQAAEFKQNSTRAENKIKALLAEIENCENAEAQLKVFPKSRVSLQLHVAQRDVT